MKVLRTWEEVAALRKRSGRVGVRRVQLALDGLLPADYAARTEQRINRSLNACGCATAAVFVACGIVIASVAFTFNWEFPCITTSCLGMWLFGWLLMLSVIGKLVGLGISLWQLNRVINQIESVISDRTR